MSNKSFLFFLFFLLLCSVVVAQDLPTGLQKIVDYNNDYTESFSTKISFIIAFIAGMLGILSPCILPFIPAYFSYTFKEKKNITAMTLVFFLGFSLVFVAMGVIAGIAGERSLTVLQLPWLVSIAGALLIAMGTLSLTGKGLGSFFTFNKKFSNDVPGTFLFGISFALGWTACLGPILVGILGIGALLHNPWYSGVLLFFYSLGNLVPLFIISLAYDRFHLEKKKFIKGKVLTFAIGEDEFKIHSTNLISGLLFIILGAILIIFNGTAPFNTYDVFGTRQFFYSIQEALINWSHANLIGGLFLLGFVVLVGLFLWKRYRR